MVVDDVHHGGHAVAQVCCGAQLQLVEDICKDAQTSLPELVGGVSDLSSGVLSFSECRSG